MMSALFGARTALVRAAAREKSAQIQMECRRIDRQMAFHLYIYRYRLKSSPLNNM